MWQSNRRAGWWALLSAVLVLFHVNLTWQDGDEDRHLLVARAMAEGHGQVNLHLPEPDPEVMTPPAYPFALAMLLNLFGSSLVPLMAFSAMCYVGFVYVVARIAEEDDELMGAGAWAVTMVGCFGVFMLGYAWRIFSEMPYLLVAFLAFLVVLKGDREGTAMDVIMGAILAALAALVRPVGIALFPAGVLHYAFRREWRNVLVFVAVVVAVYGPFVVRTYLLAGVPIPHMLVYDPEGTAMRAAGSSIAGLLGTMAESLPYYFFHALPRRMFFSLFSEECLICMLGLRWLITPLTVLLSLGVLAGFLIKLRKGGLAECYWLIYWPMLGTFEQWPQDRYLLPVIPLAALYLGVACTVAIRKLFAYQPRVRRKLTAAVLALPAVYVLLTAGGAGVVRLRNEIRAWGLHPWDPQRQLAIGWPDNRAFARYIQAGRWMGEHLPTNTVVVSRKPRHTYLFSGLRGHRYDGVDVKGTSTWDRITRHAGARPVAILQDGFSAESGYGHSRISMLDPALEAHRGELELVYETEEPETRVWLLPARDASGG